MQQINIKCPHSDILQETSNPVLFGEVVLIITEGDEYDGKQDIHGCSPWQVGPLELQVVPFEDIGTTEDHNHYNQGEEPLGIEQLLPTVPVSVDYIAKQEEVEISHCLDETSDVQPVVFVCLGVGKP